MHESVLAWVAGQVHARGLAALDVIELGSYDVNGSVRPLFVGDYTGIDMRPGPGVDLVAMSHAVPKPDRCVDVVVCCEMLEHDPNPPATFATAARLLRPGGVMLITTRSPGYPLHEHPDDLHRFTAHDLEELAAGVGMALVEVHPDPQVPGVFAVCEVPLGKGDTRPGGSRLPAGITVEVAFCNPGQVEIEFMQSMWSTRVADQRAAGVLIDDWAETTVGPRLHIGRHASVERFLESSADWLWWVDVDMAWTAADFYRVLAAAHPTQRPIVSGLCFGTGRGGGPLWPVIWEPDTTRGLRVYGDYPRGQIFEVAAGSSAFQVVHRSVYETLAATGDDLLPWYPDGAYGDQVLEGDIQFCLRARAAGFSIWCNSAARIAHKKPQFLDEDFFDLVMALQTQEPR